MAGFLDARGQYPYRGLAYVWRNRHHGKQRQPSINHGSLHGPGYSGGRALTRTYTLPDGQLFADDFHVFAIEWSPDQISFFVDDVLYLTKTPADVPVGREWVFDHPFFFILNVAVGGNFPGPPDKTTVFPQQLVVDYLRVYADSTKRPERNASGLDLYPFAAGERL